MVEYLGGEQSLWRRLPAIACAGAPWGVGDKQCLGQVSVSIEGGAAPGNHTCLSCSSPVPASQPRLNSEPSVSFARSAPPHFAPIFRLVLYSFLGWEIESSTVRVYAPTNLSHQD